MANAVVVSTIPLNSAMISVRTCRTWVHGQSLTTRWGSLVRTRPYILNGKRRRLQRLSPIKYQVNEDESEAEEQPRDLFVPVVVLLALAGYATTALLAWVEYNQ